MPGDPFKIFVEAEQWRRESLKGMWTELYVALAPDPADRQEWGCGFVHEGDDMLRERRARHPVAGRLWLNGPPACAKCLATRSDRPGGYPLELINPREWRE